MKTLFQLKSEIVEKKLTHAELKKREEIAQAIDRDTPDMDMSKKMAIATAAAKRVAEDTVDEAYHSIPQLKGAIYRHSRAAIEANDRGDETEVKRQQMIIYRLKNELSRMTRNESTSVDDREIHESDEEMPTGVKTYHKNKQGEEHWAINFTARAAAAHEKDLRKSGHTITGRSLMFGTKEGPRRNVTEETDTLDESAASKYLATALANKERMKTVQIPTPEQRREMEKKEKELKVKKYNEEVQLDEISKSQLQTYKASKEVIDSSKYSKHFNDKQVKQSAHRQSKSGDVSVKGVFGMKEEIQLDEITTPMQKLRDALDRHTERAVAANKAGDDEKVKVHQAYMNKIKTKMGKLAKNEEIDLAETENLYEISKSTLKSYINKSSVDIGLRGLEAGEDNRLNTPNLKKMSNRVKGIDKAVQKLTKEDAADNRVMYHSEFKKHYHSDDGGLSWKAVSKDAAEKLIRSGAKVHLTQKEKGMNIKEETSKKSDWHAARGRYDEVDESIDDAAQDADYNTGHKKGLRDAKAGKPNNAKQGISAQERKGYNDGYTSHLTPMKEEAGQIDELNKSTLASYAKKAVNDAAFRARFDNKDEPVSKKASQRMRGAMKAIDKLAKEEVEQIDELSKDTLKSYIRGAGEDLPRLGNTLGRLQTHGRLPKVEKDITKTIIGRYRGINKAVQKLTKEDAEDKEETGIGEAAGASGPINNKQPIKREDLPFDPDPPHKRIAVAGKFGYGYSAARHLARAGMQQVIAKKNKG